MGAAPARRWERPGRIWIPRVIPGGLPIQNAFVLVGSLPAAVQTAAGAALSTWAYGQSPTANDLLIARVTVTETATLPTTPAGWTLGPQVAGTSCSATIYYKVAAGGDGVPTIAAITSGLIAGQLAEYSGGPTTSPLDQSASATGTTSPITATAGANNAAISELYVCAGADVRSVARTSSDTWTSNEGTVTQDGSNNATSSKDHYSFGAIIGTTSLSAMTAVMTLSQTTSITGLAVVVASFKLAPLPPPPTYIRKFPNPWELLPL